MEKILNKLSRANHAEFRNGKIEILPSEYYLGNFKLPRKIGEWLWDKF